MASKGKCANKYPIFSLRTLNAHLTPIVKSDSIIPSPAQVTPLNEDRVEWESRPEEAGFTQPPLREHSAFVCAVTRRHCASPRRAFCLSVSPIWDNVLPQCAAIMELVPYKLQHPGALLTWHRLTESHFRVWISFKLIKRRRLCLAAWLGFFFLSLRREESK